jgi:hypothetical protein
MAQHFRYKKYPHHKKTAVQRFFSWLLLLVFASFSTFLVEQNTTNFQTSILGALQPPAFDGTVLPVQKAPNWVALSADEWDMSYSQMPLSKIKTIPKYEPQKLRLSTDTLTWGDPQDDAIRNAKITYSVPYMGNYRLDGKEYSGSHLAVDIKVPSGTPVYAIGNGIITKTSEQLYGFGKHVVIEHKDFPSYDNANTKTTYHSSYSHLKSINVTENSVVHKGDIIGYIGSTGISSTPHLHFQIDNSSAPWHPFWPFTSKEASDAGLSFTGAVNEGLNQDIAIANTINPMLYVQKYQDGTVVEDTPTPTPTTTTTTTSTPTTTSTTPTTTSSDTTTSNDFTENFVSFEIITGGDTITEGEDKEIQIKAINIHRNIVSDYNPESPVKIEVIMGSAAISHRRLTASDFENGIATITLTPSNSSPVKFHLKTDNLIKESPVLSPGIFVDIGTAHPHFNAISFLKDEGIIQGYPDGSFKPNNEVSRVEVMKFILEGIDTEIQTATTLNFRDTNINEWYADYLFTAKKLGVVEGYPDGSFKPSASVNKVEFLKMLILAANIDIDPEVRNVFNLDDVKNDDWFAPYVKFAIEKNIIDFEGNKFYPGEEMKRDKIAEAIYRIKILNETGANEFTADLVNEIENNSG